MFDIDNLVLTEMSNWIGIEPSTLQFLLTHEGPFTPFSPGETLKKSLAAATSIGQHSALFFDSFELKRRAPDTDFEQQVLCSMATRCFTQAMVDHRLHVAERLKAMFC
jgi:hypothetical protein